MMKRTGRARSVRSFSGRRAAPHSTSATNPTTSAGVPFPPKGWNTNRDGISRSKNA